MMSAERIAELRALCDRLPADEWKVVTYTDPTGEVESYLEFDLTDEYVQNFVMAARTALPEALDEIERLRSENAQLQGIDRARDSSDAMRYAATGVEIKQLRAEIERLQSALEQEAIGKAQNDTYTLEVLRAGDIVGKEVDVGGLRFVIGCDEHANMTAAEWHGDKPRRA